MSDRSERPDSESDAASHGAADVTDIAVARGVALEPAPPDAGIGDNDDDSPGTLEIYEGPIPRPEELLDYNNVREGLAGDIAQNYLEDCAFRRKLEQQRFEDGRESARAGRSLARQEFEVNTELSRKELVLQGRSQWMAFVLAILALGVTAFGFYVGASLSAIPFIMVTIGILISRFIGRNDTNDEIRLLTSMARDARQKALPKRSATNEHEPAHDLPISNPNKPTDPEQETKGPPS